METPQKTNLIFDFGCVLVDLDKECATHAFEAIGCQKVAKYIDLCRQEDLFHRLETGLTTEEEFCQEVRRMCLQEALPSGEILRAWGLLLKDIPQRRFLALERLRAKHRLFLLSNTNSVHWRIAEERLFRATGKSVEHYFSGICLSYKVHLVKPDKEIFRLALGNWGLKAGDCLFIDDSEANCQAARETGIAAFHAENGDSWLSIE